jgi:hypothetical protein
LHRYGIVFVSDELVLTRLLDAQSDNELGQDVATEYQLAAQQSGRLFFPVYFLCDLDENVKRLTSSERINSGTTKLTDADLFKTVIEDLKLFAFDDVEGLTLDVTHMPPKEIAMKLLEHTKSHWPENQLP